MECHKGQERRSSKLSQKQFGIHHRTLVRLPAVSSTMSTIMFVLFSLMCLFTTISACNIDTTRPVIYKPPSKDSGVGQDYSDGLFGYTVLQHKASLTNYLLIGAPTANSYYLSFNEPVERPGVLFLCYALSPYSCFEINLDESGNQDPVGPELKNVKDNAWIGVSLTRQPTKSNGDLSDITVCGHRYANDYFVKDSITTVNTTFDPNDRFPNGICYTFGHSNGDIDAGSSDGVKLTIPCAGENQTDGINTRVHGWCQAGVSSQYTSDGNRIMLGAAGSYNWTGTVFQGDRVDLNFQPAADVWGEDNDYIGYALTSGRFLSKDTIQGVTSAPRAMKREKEITEGKVIIYDLDTHEIYQELYGEMMGTYYGAAIKALDLNNDGWSDLLVGAPMYSIEQDEGRVYVYINNGRGKVEPLDFKLSGSDAFGARFGSAIAGAGDLNNDDFEDVIIGAPWEDDNSGAIYVYFGRADGIQKTYSQRLAGKDFVPDIKSFGISLDGGTDLDLNALPDIVAGAAASETVILFKTRPVANMRVWLLMDPDPLDPDIQNCELDGNPITCVNVSVCFFYKAASTPPNMDMDIELTVDYFRINDGLSGRFYFLEDGEPTESFYRLVKAYHEEEVCYPYKAYLEKKAQDFLTPLSFQLYYGIHEYPYEEDPRGDNPERFVGGLPPIIDEDICGNGTHYDELRFIQDCGADAVCQTDLQLTGNVIFPGGESYFSLGTYSTMRVQFQVDNVGEEAHTALVVVRHSREIRFEAIEKSESSCLTDESVSAADSNCALDVVVTCIPVQAQNGTAAVECALGNPMKSYTSSFLSLRFDVGAVTYEHSKGVLDVSVEARTISTELDPSNNVYKPHIPVKVEADITVRGISNPASVYYETNTTAKENPEVALMEALVAAGIISYDKMEEMRNDYDGMDVVLQNITEEVIIDEESIGPPFSLLFEAPNLGPGRLPFDSVLYISIPWRLNNGDWLIYIKDIQTKGVAGTCNSKEVLELQDFRLEEHYVDRASSPDTDLEKGYTKANGVETSKNSNKLACSNAKCVTMKCSIDGPILSGDSFVVVIDALLFVPTFIESQTYLRIKEIISSAAIEVISKEGEYEQPKGHEPDHYNLATGVFTDQPPKEPIAWWIILLSVLGGILLLILIILILYKVGFFKRKTKDEMEKMQQASTL